MSRSLALGRETAHRKAAFSFSVEFATADQSMGGAPSWFSALR